MKHDQTGQNTNSTDGKLNDNPLTESIQRPEPPGYLNVLERKLWIETIESLPDDWFVSADMTLFESFVRTTISYRLHLRELNQTGEVYEDDKGILRAVPTVAIMEKERSALITISGKLLLHPRSRSGSTLSPARKKAQAEERKQKTGRRKGLVFIPGGKKD